MYSLALTTPPSIEPITPFLLKKHLRLNTDIEDDLLAIYIAEARKVFESDTQRQIMSATYTLYLDNWYGEHHKNWVYGGSIYNAYFFANYFHFNTTLSLPKPPLQQINSISYYDTTNTLQTLPTNEYLVDAARTPARLRFLQTPNLFTDRMPRIMINYTAGYTSVPLDLMGLLLKMAASNYWEREANNNLALKESLAYRSEIMKWKVMEIEGGYNL